MKLQVLQENFSKEISTASRITSSRAQLPILANILLVAEKNKLVISATNLEIFISTPIGAKVEQEGSITIPSKVLGEIVSNLNSGPLDILAEKEVLTLKQDTFKSEIPGMNASDFPQVSAKLIKSQGDLVETRELVDVLSTVLFSVSYDETRPSLTGVLLYSKDGLLEAVSTDGFRLSRIKTNIKVKKDFERVIVPKNILGEFLRLSLIQKETEFLIDRKEKQIVFKTNGGFISSRVIEGEFPDFEKIIPTKHSTVVNVDKNDFLRSVKLASVFARDSANVVRMEIKGGKIKIVSESQYSGAQTNSFEAATEGDDLSIAFNYKFLEEVLTVIKGDSLVMEFNDPNQPGVFKDPQRTNYLHLIMPVKI